MSLEDDLGDLLRQPTAEESTFTPHFEFDGATGTGTISTGPMPIEQDFDFEQMMRRFNKDPALYEVTYTPSETIWEQRARNRETNEFETTLLHAWKNARFQRKGAASSADLEALVLSAKERKPSYTQGSYWAVFQAGDLQLGKKSSAGSTQQIVERYLQAVDNAVREIRSLKRLGLEGIQISMPGDCIEGTVSQASKNLWLTAETAPEQTRVLRRLMFHTVETFAPLANRVYLDVVNGNHDQAQREQNTYPGDGWATEQAIEVSDRLGDNPTSFGHCEVRVPDKWRGCMTVPVGDSVVTVVHGHQFRRNKGGDWWAGQTLNGLPAGASQVLQHGHYHTWEVEEVSATRTRVESPTFDCGSDWYSEKTGASSRRGGLVYLLRGGVVSRMTVV
jgi:hypothetical protein